MKKLVPIAIALFAACGAGRAPEEARAWAARNYPGERFNIDCIDRDTDEDGYASCTLVHQPAEAGGTRMPPMGLQCTTGNAGSCNAHGCKLSAIR